MPVTAVMSRDVLVVDAQDPIIEVWQRMHDLGTPVAVVRDDSRIVAVVSQRTLAMWWPSGLNVSPQTNSAPSSPPRAANSHSASVGRSFPAHWAYAAASANATCTTGCSHNREIELAGPLGWRQSAPGT